jgi:hypothetical protein
MQAMISEATPPQGCYTATTHFIAWKRCGIRLALVGLKGFLRCFEAFSFY